MAQTATSRIQFLMYIPIFTSFIYRKQAEELLTAVSELVFGFPPGRPQLSETKIEKRQQTANELAGHFFPPSVTSEITEKTGTDARSSALTGTAGSPSDIPRSPR